MPRPDPTPSPVATELVSALANLAKCRDAASWAVILDRLGPDLQRVCARLAGNASLADDALQECLLRVRDHAGSFVAPADDRAEAAARGWVLRIAATTTLMLVRQRSRAARRERQAPFPANSVGGLAAADERDEVAVQVRQALAALPEAWRTAVVLHHVAGLDVRAVAQALGLPEGTVKSRLHRGRDSLRRTLQRAGVVVGLAAVPGLFDLLARTPLPTVHQMLLHAPRQSAWSPLSATVPLSKGLVMLTTVSAISVAALVALSLTMPGAAADGLAVGGGLEASPPRSSKPAATAAPSLQQKVTVKFQGTPLREAMSTLAAMTGTTIVIDGKVDGSRRIELTTKDMSLSECLRWITTMADARFDVRGGRIRILPAR